MLIAFESKPGDPAWVHEGFGTREPPTPNGAWTVIGSDPVPRRRQAWGLLWSRAPWDGKPVVSTPVVAPAAPAAMAALKNLADAPRSRVLSRTAFGQLLKSAPWSARPQLPSSTLPAIDDTSVGLETTPPPSGVITTVITPSMN